MNSRPRFIPNLKAVRFKDINKTGELQTESNETEVTDTIAIETPPVVSRTDSLKQRTIVQQEGLFAATIGSGNTFSSSYIDVPKCLQDSSAKLEDDHESSVSVDCNFSREPNIFEDCDFVTFKVPKMASLGNRTESGQIGKLVQLRSGKWKFMLNNGQLLDVQKNSPNHSDSLLTNFDFDNKTNIGNIVNLGVKTSLFSIEFNE